MRRRRRTAFTVKKLSYGLQLLLPRGSNSNARSFHRSIGILWSQACNCAARFGNVSTTAAGLAMANTLTCWEYINNGLPAKRRHHRGNLWVDSRNSDVAWQSTSHTTPWHGQVEFSPMGCTVSFDCYMGSHRRPHGTPYLKTAVMWSTLSGDYVGHDYQGRMIRMVPMSRFTHVQGPDNDGAGAWVLTQTWDNGQWRDLEDAWHPVAAA